MSICFRRFRMAGHVKVVKSTLLGGTCVHGAWARVDTIYIYIYIYIQM
jgi:hypothetical protein